MAKFAMISGKLVDIQNFTGCDVCIYDIAHHLSKIQRFNGALPLDTTYSVGEHCINLVRYAAKIGGFSRLGLKMLLIHDASEAYLSDVVSPAKKSLPDYVKLENHIQKIINKKFTGVECLIDSSSTLKELDKRILIDEVEHIKPKFLDLYVNETGLNKLGCHIEFNNHPSTVKHCFLKLARDLGVIWNK